MTLISVEVDTKWYANEARPCKADYRYSELQGTTKLERDEMKAACVSDCPVYYECLKDLLAHPKWLHYGIQAGIQGKT